MFSDGKKPLVFSIWFKIDNKSVPSFPAEILKVLPLIKHLTAIVELVVWSKSTSTLYLFGSNSKESLFFSVAKVEPSFNFIIIVFEISPSICIVNE